MRLRIIEDEISIAIDELEKCHKSLVEELKINLSSLDIQRGLRNRSKSLKQEIQQSNSSSSAFKWVKHSIFSDRSLTKASAGYLIDARAECSQNCGSFHQVNIVICLNNREAIGTNFLKLEVAAVQEIRNHQNQPLTDKNVLGLLITLDREMLNFGGWDGAYADATEYVFAYNLAYRSVIKSQIIGLQLHSA
jgi:hypothetical protein